MSQHIDAANLTADESAMLAELQGANIPDAPATVDGMVSDLNAAADSKGVDADEILADTVDGVELDALLTGLGLDDSDGDDSDGDDSDGDADGDDTIDDGSFTL